MSVFDLYPAQRAIITKINVTGSAAQRLRSLGFIAGSEVTAIGFSLFKSSILVSCGAVRLGLRKSVARQIEVEVCA